MKKIIFLTIAFLFLFTFSSFAQNDTIWFDNNWNETTKSKASFYRCECSKTDDGYWYIDYYISGTKQMEGLSLDKNKEVYDGEVKWYFENGTTFQIVNYKKGVLDGKRQVFYEDGKLKVESYYENGKLNGKWNEYYENSKLKETGFYKDDQRDDDWKCYYNDGRLKSEGKFIFDNKIGDWKTYYYEGVGKD